MIIITLALLALQIPDADRQREPQGVEYVIEARLEERLDVLTGRARMTYTNNAPEVIDTLWFYEHLNAFRPNSAWATRELEFGTRRFQDLRAREHAFEQLTGVSVDGQPVEPIYPGAPDSTVVAVPLPNALAQGESVVVELNWNARLSTLPRRQGRRDRHYDFAQWYPRIAAYTEEGWQVQPLLPQGEFFGEFATYDVTLEVNADQVIGATGVPVEGDPGWENAAAQPGLPIDYQRDYYGPTRRVSLGLLDEAGPPSRKLVRWRAEQVHHFAWSADPDFVYESGSVNRGGPAGGTIPIHVLYWPSDNEWADVAVERTAIALNWLQDRMGPYAWPQLTNLHRLESGGTEFPMVIMDGSASQGLIMHEVGHQWVHGMLANNEFREGWLDEGFSSYLTDSFHEENGELGIWDGTLDAIRRLETAGRTEPINLPGAEFTDPAIYSLMSYSKAELVLRMLEWLVGESTMRAALRIYYDDNVLAHVTEADFRAAVEEAAGTDLGWFFDQWIHSTAQLDYVITDAVTVGAPDGGWMTQVDVRRDGNAWMPVTLQVGDQDIRLESRDRVQSVQVYTEQRPTSATLDPGDYLIDTDPGNNTAIVREG